MPSPAASVLRAVLAPALAPVLALSLLGAAVSAPVPASAMPADRGPARVAPPPLTAQSLATDVARALKADAYPAGLRPKLGDVNAGMALTMTPAAQCMNPDDLLNTDRCNYGPADAPKLAMVIGDSVAASYLPGLADALVPRGYRVHGLMLSGCPVALVESVFPKAGTAERCNRSKTLIYAQVQRMDPDLLIMSESAAALQRLASGNREAAAEAEFLAGEREALSRLGAPGRTLVVLSSNPQGGDLKSCYVDRTSPPADCVLPVAPWWYASRRAERRAAAEYGATYVDTLSWYASGGYTPAFANGVSMRWDGNHITSAYSRMLAPLLREAILGGRPAAARPRS